MAKNDEFSQRDKRKQRVSMIQQGDILLVDFGRRMGNGRFRPVFVMSGNEVTRGRGRILGIPLYRHESDSSPEKDVLIRTIDCNSLRYDQYAQVAQMQGIPRFRIVRRIGRVRGKEKFKELEYALWKHISDGEGVKA